MCLQLANFVSEARQLRALENLRQPGPGVTHSRSAGEDARERIAAGGDAEATFPALAAKLFVSLFLASKPNHVGTSDTALVVDSDVLDLHPQVSDELDGTWAVAHVVGRLDHPHANRQSRGHRGLNAADRALPASLPVGNAIVDVGVVRVEGRGEMDVVALEAAEEVVPESCGVGKDLDQLEASVVGVLHQIVKPRVHRRLAADELDAAAAQFGRLVDDSAPMGVTHLAVEVAQRP
jgi:hypothetical protein